LGSGARKICATQSIQRSSCVQVTKQHHKRYCWPWRHSVAGDGRNRTLSIRVPRQHDLGFCDVRLVTVNENHAPSILNNTNVHDRHARPVKLDSSATITTARASPSSLGCSITHVVHRLLPCSCSAARSLVLLGARILFSSESPPLILA